jgi:acetyltransferase-like isoleucine patch superfamily enzyme
MKLPVYVNEKMSVFDIIFKYILRDFILGVFRNFPSAIGIMIRMVLYKLFLKKSGKGLRIADMVTIKFPEHITVGDNVSFNEYDWIDGNGEIIIGNYVSVGPRVSIVSFEHGHSDIETPIKRQPKELGKVVIEDNVWIGAGATILSNVTIGTGSIIAAGAVVRQDVEPYSIVGGVPAVLLKKRDI